MSHGYDVYYYWDQVGSSSKPTYIDLCLESWAKYAGAKSITRVSLENIEEVTGGVINARQLRLFTPPQRSDAAMIAVMNGRAGLFMDADTLLLPSFDPSRYFEGSMPTMYAKFGNEGTLPMLAFLANPNVEARFLGEWAAKALQAIKREDRSAARRFRRLYRGLLGKRVHVRWDYLGAAILNDLASNQDLRGAIQFLDAQVTGFLPEVERPDYGPDTVNPYWLGADTDSAFAADDYPHGIVTFQNSWMPRDIKALGRRELLDHPSRLGRLLSHSLGR